jgi:signal transduction histidine kinase
MINTVIRNLVSNAIKFTYEDGEVILSAYEYLENKDYWQISISDNGTGIPENKINDIFRIVKSSPSLGTANETGTGLGLIICKEFIERHGGKIWVESEIDSGSTFSFTLPKI